MLGFYLLERHGCSEEFVRSVAEVMEYDRAYDLYRGDRLVAEAVS
jgi:hypothetical protein